MQFDMFATGEADVRLPALQLLEDSSWEYKPRTQKNAREADATVAFAVDFETAGERLTHRSAGPRYVGVQFGTEISDAAGRLSKFLRERHANSLNVAGNGIYTLAQHRVTQAEANQWVYDVLKLVSKSLTLSVVRSGGQTGIDTAGLVAALALGIPAIGFFPKGFRTRGEDKRDVNNAEADIERLLMRYVRDLAR